MGVSTALSCISGLVQVRLKSARKQCLTFISLILFSRKTGRKLLSSLRIALMCNAYIAGRKCLILKWLRGPGPRKRTASSWNASNSTAPRLGARLPPTYPVASASSAVKGKFLLKRIRFESISEMIDRWLLCLYYILFLRWSLLLANKLSLS